MSTGRRMYTYTSLNSDEWKMTKTPYLGQDEYILFTPTDLKSFAEQVWRAARQEPAVTMMTNYDNQGWQQTSPRWQYEDFADYWKEREK